MKSRFSTSTLNKNARRNKASTEIPIVQRAALSCHRIWKGRLTRPVRRLQSVGGDEKKKKEKRKILRTVERLMNAGSLQRSRHYARKSNELRQG